MKVYFSDFFEVPEKILDKYGAFNVSLVTDLPLFIDPFLLFNSRKPDYQKLHRGIVRYLRFLHKKSTTGTISSGSLKAWYYFSEVKQNWLGFCKSGNEGRGLALDFANALNTNFTNILSDFGRNKVTKGIHLEKLCLIKDGVGKDTISDFTTNLIKRYLLKYTQSFARKHIHQKYRKRKAINRVRFNYRTESWESAVFDLPVCNGEYVLLTPRDILTKDDDWINKTDIFKDYDEIPIAISDAELRANVNNYFLSILPKNPKQKDRVSAIDKVIHKYPDILDYYIRYKEDRGNDAVARSSIHVNDSKAVYVRQFGTLVDLLSRHTKFYQTKGDTADDAVKRIEFLKHVIEDKGGYRYFYHKGNPIAKEDDVHIMYKLTWFATESDVTAEANDGRGPVDFKISRGSKDKTLVEFKLASNPQLRRNLENQLHIYKKASDASIGYSVIIYFTAAELDKVERMLKQLDLVGNKHIILIDARQDNKPSGSKA